MYRLPPQFRRTGCWTLLFLLATGCSSMPSLNLLETTQEEPESPSGPMIAVEFRDADGTPYARAMPYEEPMHLQDVVERAGVRKHYSRFKIAVFRRAGQGYQRMGAEYDRSRKHVAPEYDYALRPHDRVVFTEDTSTIIDDMFHKISGPLGRMANR